MSQYRTHITEKIRAPIGDVFDRLGDHNRMGEWMMADIRRVVDSTVAGEGVNGTGSVRLLKILGLSDFDETVVKSKKPETIEYKITRGSPLSNHLGVITLKEENGAVAIDWNITFEMGIGGIVVEQLLKLAVGNGLSKLKKQMETSR
jgi:uncharacterized protein YndB with AHSA1/START domain